MDVDDRKMPQQHEVRLFPTLRISSDREAELRATASLLAMARAVSEFGRSFVRMAGGPVGRLTAYTEVPLTTDAKPGQPPDELRPDGVVRVVRGKREWKALVEVKVGDNALQQDQFDSYHVLASAKGFDAVITISNQPAQSNSLPPLSIDGRRLRRVPVVHFSWERLLSEAQMLSQKKGVADSDQEWMLDEWIKYVGDERSRIIQKPDLGKHWHEVLQAARSGNLHTVSPALEDVVVHWIGFLRKVALRLRAKLGVEVQPKMSRSERLDPSTRIKRLHTHALKDGTLSGLLRIPDAVDDVSIDVLLQSRAVKYRVSVSAPTEGRAATRVKWLTRQLKPFDNAPEDLLVTAEWDQRGLVCQSKLRDLRADDSRLLSDTCGAPVPKSASPRRFILEWTAALPKGRGRSSVRILDGIAANLDRFYQTVVERLVPYVPRAPRLDGAGVAGPEEVTKVQKPKADEVNMAERQAASSQEETTSEHEQSGTNKAQQSGTGTNIDGGARQVTV